MASNITLHIQNNETISEMFTRTKMNTSTINTVCDEIMKEIFSMNNQLRNIKLNGNFKGVFPKIYDILLKHIKDTKLTGNNLTYKEIAKQIMEKMDKNVMSIINGTHYSNSLKVKNAYNKLPPGGSGRFSNAFGMPQISAIIHKGMINQNAPPLVSLNPVNETHRPSPFMDNKDLLGKPQFAIGDYKKEYDGYRKATKDDVTNLTFQAALVKAHREGSGWPLLEEPLDCFRALRVADGLLMIDEEPVIKVGWNDNEHAQGVYPAMNLKTGVPWTTKEPELGNKWTFIESKVSGKDWTLPCLFVHKSYNKAQQGSSRRSRRHKRNRHVKKQKKRTRKH